MPEDFQEKSKDKEEEDIFEKLRKKSSEYKPRDIENEEWIGYEDVPPVTFEQEEKNGE